MALRKALPAGLDPRVRQLATHLRRLTDHSELSMRQLAVKTGYSQKSWERYLGGRSLPPAEAVEALARICGDDPVRLLALHEVAADTWDSARPPASPSKSPSKSPSRGPEAERAEAAPPTEPEIPANPEALPGRALRIALMAGAVALVLAVSSAVLLAVRLDDDRDAQAVAPPAPSAAAASSPDRVYTCGIKRIDGLWYAGISPTRSTEIFYGSAGPEVAEAQCLLRRAGISPGGIDGKFGPLTQRAVKAMQKRSGLDVDGMVGPNTWKALRA
ncbi:peptidoglycan-binding protein [Streptomyces sp. NPDC050263]|uniref:peptidoglycan-binding protein n=1 Tax=Streptomyces sp. NPDC050263 TaxID=3155037 RepID=UPI00342C9EC9